MSQDLEIFTTSKEYSSFFKNKCGNCKKVSSCPTRNMLIESYTNRFGFPTDEIHRIDGEWVCANLSDLR